MTNRQKRGRIQSLELSLRIAESLISDLIADNTEAVGRGPAAGTRTHEPMVGPDFYPQK